MGKSRQRKRTENQHGAIKPVKPPSDPELAALREEKIVPLIKNLTNSDPTVRTSAAIAISSTIEDTKFRKLFLREQLVKILLEQTLTDQVLELRSVGWAILRTLALNEEFGFSIHLYRLGISSAIERTIQSVSLTLKMAVLHTYSRLLNTV
jgi:hypothetical protein